MPAISDTKVSKHKRLVSVELTYAQWCDAESVFANFAAEPDAIFLDSAGSEHPDSRYDMLFRAPEQRICVQDAAIHAKSDNLPDPFQQLQLAIDRLPEYCGNSSLPFQGGAVGYFSYDLGRIIESLPEMAQKDIALPDMYVGIYTRALIIDHKQSKVFAICPDGETDQVEAFWKAPHHNATSAFRLKGEWRSNMSESIYHQKVSRIHDYLHSGDCYQINLAQRFTAPCEGDPWQAYQQLRHTNSAPFSAFIRLPTGAVLSVSPERFLQTDTLGNVATRPIKGTRPRGDTQAKDQAEITALKNSAKDQAENLMIVDLLRNDLSRVCRPGSVHVPQLFAIESFKAVHHLVSTVQGQLEGDNTPVSLLRATFPGGSITGAPKVRAMEIIEELEPHRRSVYCGSIGYISQHGQMDTNITIRTLCVSEDNIFCWAGGGIVADSKADAEYQETLDKVNRILPVLSAHNRSDSSGGSGYES